MNVEKRESSTRRPRARLVPPRLGEVERRTRSEPGAQRFNRGLRAGQRRSLLVVMGNGLLLAVLIGGPWLRGHYRALATQRAHAAFLGCLYGVPIGGGLGELAHEAEYFAAQLARAERDWPRRCTSLLDALAPSPALFVLPSVKDAEARVREALALTRGELRAAESYAPGQRMPERALRALQLLRSTVRTQVLQASVSTPEWSEVPATAAEPPGLATPARLPLYAAPDASLLLWGDDQVLRTVALDATGLSYLEAQGGRPFTRARLVRPSSLRAYARDRARGWLVWATSAERCAGRVDGCFGKTTRIAEAPAAVLELPAARPLAAHLAGRADRSLAATRDGLLLAARAPGGGTALEEFALPAATPADAELPALSATGTWPARLDEALVLPAPDDAVVLGLRREGSRTQLLHVRARSATPLGELGGAESTWLAGCASDEHAAFAFGAAGAARIGTLTLGAVESGHAWADLALALKQAIDPERPERDRVAVSCLARGALLVAHEADDSLSAIFCAEQARACRKLPVARDVTYFSVLATERGALLAYAGAEAAQVRLRTFDAARAALGPERIPAACWSKGGLCSKPTLARLGRRILLVAPERTDLLALESADEGESWTAPPVL